MNYLVSLESQKFLQKSIERINEGKQIFNQSKITTQAPTTKMPEVTILPSFFPRFGWNRSKIWFETQVRITNNLCSPKHSRGGLRLVHHLCDRQFAKCSWIWISHDEAVLPKGYGVIVVEVFHHEVYNRCSINLQGIEVKEIGLLNFIVT